ncbi:hypothetical protein P0D71_00630 [Paraburkholderia sp. RL17-383-BIF-A]|uniref:hypothetical protein n=1 Tax=Paraburkholderia sp. RL17-383-BIF-A TaxID=3031631 RepID=UPI0038BB1C9A
MSHFYSASKSSFLDADLREAYESAGTWPADAKEIDDELFIQFGCSNPPAGKVRGASTNGDPCWVDAPAPTSAQLWADVQADAKSALEASDVIVLRCYESGIPLPQEWAAYRKVLRTIVNSTVMDASQKLPSKPASPSWP